MSYTQGLYPIIKKKSLAKNIFDFTILCPEVAAEAAPGQFVHIKAEGFMLRRPISICGIDKEKGTVRVIVSMMGKDVPVELALTDVAALM